MAYRARTLRCVACERPLEEMVVGSYFECLGCDGCAGLWVEAGQLISFIRAVHPDKGVDELVVHNYSGERRRCPSCREPMDMVWLGMLQLDQCAAHGVWLDRGELERIARWDLDPPDLPKPKERR